MSEAAGLDNCSVEASTAPSRDDPRPWPAFVAAVGFLTRIPVSLPAPEALAQCPAYFPLVGAMIGVCTATLFAACCQLWPAWLAVVIATAAEAWITGALHEDALADWCDAFGGGWTREQVLTILRDSRIGVYGALGLGLAVALRVGALVEVVAKSGLENWLQWGSVVVASACVSRWVMVLVMFWLPPVPLRESLAQGVGSRLTIRDLLLATLWTLPPIGLFAVLNPWGALLAAVLLAVTVVWFVRLVKHRLGGMTGDCAGCIGYLANVLILLAVAARNGT